MLSITIQPALAALGAYSAEIFPPGENNPIWALEKSNSESSSTVISFLLNSIFFPLDFDDANKLPRLQPNYIFEPFNFLIIFLVLL